MEPIPDATIMLEARLRETRSDNQSRDAYDTLYKETNLSLRPSYYKWLMHLFNIQTGEAYLDVSCGRGQLTSLATEKGALAHGLDFSYQVLLNGQAETASNFLTNGNSQQLPYANNSFDIISNIGSLEHYVDMDCAVKEMARVLKPGGRAYVLVPNTFSLLVNIWIAFRHGRTSIDPYQPIQRYAARQEWQNLLAENGLTVVKTLKYEREFPRTWPDVGYYLSHPKALIRLLATPFIPLNLAFCFLFVCQKAKIG